MKGFFKLLGLICLVLTMLPLASCSEDSDIKAPGQNEIEKETGMRLSEVGDLHFNYGTDDKSIEVYDTHKEETLKVDWNKMEIGFVGYSNPSKFKTNDKGYITEFSRSWNFTETDKLYTFEGNRKTLFSYDKDGHLINVSFVYEQTTTSPNNLYSWLDKTENSYYLTWKNGNLTHIEYLSEWIDYNSHGSESIDYEISYDTDIKNVYRQWTQGILDEALRFDFRELAHLGLYGIGTVNIPTNIHVEKPSSEEDISIRISTDANDLIVLERVDGTRIKYSYEKIDTRSNMLQHPL